MDLDKPKSDGELFNELTKGPDFLTRMSLCHPLSDVVNKAGIKPGNFYLNWGEEAIDLGNEVVVVIGPWRPHALLLRNKEAELESFDPESEEFKQIQQTQKKSQEVVPLVGIDYLLHLPEHNETAVFFFNKTAARAAKDLYKLAEEGHQVALLTSFFNEGKKNSWWIPKAEPHQLDDAPALPADRVEKFSQPHGPGVEEATGEAPLR